MHAFKGGGLIEGMSWESFIWSRPRRSRGQRCAASMPSRTLRSLRAKASGWPVQPDSPPRTFQRREQRNSSPLKIAPTIMLICRFAVPR